MTPDVLRIALVGKTGCGKSSSGNTILGRKEFVATAGGTSVTEICSKEQSDVDGRRVAVVDTPGLFDTKLSNEQTTMETYRSISLLAPGPHAFLLVLKIGRFTPEEKETVEYIKEAFGEKTEKYSMILFTHGDDLEFDETSIEEYISQSDPVLKKLISDCGNRFHMFNNRNKDRAQVKELLEKIDLMVKENGGRYYSSEMLREAEEAIQKEKERILKEKEEEIRREQEKIQRKYQQEMEQMIQMEKQRQEEEKKQLQEQFLEMDEKMKKEQLLRQEEENKRREQEFKERIERERAEEMQRLQRFNEEQARREAELQNSFLEKMMQALTSGVMFLFSRFFTR